MAGWASAAQAVLGAGGAMFAGHGAQKAAGVASNIMAGGYQDARDQFRQSMDAGNAYLQDASGKAIDWAKGAADFAGSSAVNQATASSQDVSNRAAAAAAGVNTAATGANAMFDPYRQAGTTALGQIGDLANKQFTFGQDDPSYQWRLQQGQQALERSQAARGGSMGGAAAKAMARYGQGAASTEYQAAFDRFQQNRGQQLAALGGLAQLGYGASGLSGANLIGAARYGGDINYNAGQYGGNLMNQATQYAGNVGINAAQYGGNALMNTAGELAGNERWGGSNMANMTLGRAGALSAGVLGQQAGKNQMWNAFSQGAMGAAGAPWGQMFNRPPQMPGENWQFGGYDPSQLNTGGQPMPTPQPGMGDYTNPWSMPGGGY